nr:mediator of DNA damage checkpoint protein 1-like [Misgurnus anguillicaudatus]
MRIYRRPKKSAAVSRPFFGWLIARVFLAMYNWLVSFLGRQPSTEPYCRDHSGEPEVHRGQFRRRPRMPAVEPAVMPVHRISDTARETCPVLKAQKPVLKFSAASNKGGLSKGPSMSYPGSLGLTPHKRPTCTSQPSGTKLVEEFPPGGPLDAREGPLLSRGLSTHQRFAQPSGRRPGPGRIQSAKISQTVTVTYEEVDASFRQRSNAPPVRPLICPVPARVTRRPMAARPPVRSSEDICLAQPEIVAAGETGRGPAEGQQGAGRARSSGGRARSSGGPGPQPVVPSAVPQRVLPSAGPLPVLPTAAPLMVLPTATATRGQSCEGPTSARVTRRPMAARPPVRSSEDICLAQPEIVAAGATGRGPAEGRQRAGRARSSGGRARSSGGRARSCEGRAHSSGGPGPQPVVQSAGPQRVLPSGGPLPVLPTAAPLMVPPTATATRGRSCEGPTSARVTRRPMAARPPVRSSEDICLAQPEIVAAGATGRGPAEGRQRAGRARSSGGRARSSGGRARSCGGRAHSSGGPGPQPVVQSAGPQPVVQSAGPQRVLPSAGPLPVLPTAAPLLLRPTATATRGRSCEGPTRARVTRRPMAARPPVRSSEDICLAQLEIVAAGATGRGPAEGQQRAGPARSSVGRTGTSGGRARSCGGRARSSGGPGPQPVIFPPWAAPATSLCTSVAQPSLPQVQPAPACAPHKRHAGAMSQEIQTRKRARFMPPAQPSLPQVQPAPACAPHKRHAGAMSQEIQTRKRARFTPPPQPSSTQAVLSEQKRRKRRRRRQRQRRNRAIQRALQAQSASTLQASSSTAVSQASISSAIDSLERKLFCLSVHKK